MHKIVLEKNVSNSVENQRIFNQMDPNPPISPIHPLVNGDMEGQKGNRAVEAVPNLILLTDNRDVPCRITSFMLSIT